MTDDRTETQPAGEVLVGEIAEKWPLAGDACVYVVDVRCPVATGDSLRIVGTDGRSIVAKVGGLEVRGKMLPSVEDGQPGILLHTLQAEVGASVYKPGAVAPSKPSLAEAVCAELDRLGARLAPVVGHGLSPLTLGGRPVPGPMAEFLRDVTWPRLTYGSSEDADAEIWAVEFGYAGWLDPDEVRIRDRGDRDLFYFALADGGNYFLALDGADPEPADPQVYEIDHDDPDQELTALAPLSAFLACLVPEGTAESD